MELNNVDAPPQFTDPQSNRTCVLLGVPAHDVADSFLMPGDLKVRIVTVRLLTFDECLVIRRFGPDGRKAIAGLFARDGTHHVSSIRAPPRESIDLALRELKQNTLNPGPPNPTETVITPNGDKVVFEYFRVGPRPTEDIVWDADKIRKRLIELQVNALAQLKAAAAAGIGMAAAPQAVGQLGTLPAIDERTPKPELEVKALFQAFAKPTAVSSAMSRFDTRLRQMVMGPAPANPQGLAKHVVSALATHTQLAGWKHVQDYIIDPKAYLEKINAARNSDLPRGETVADPYRAIDVLTVTGERLVQRMLQRMEWLLDLQTRAQEEFDPDFFLAVRMISSFFIFVFFCQQLLICDLWACRC